MLYSVICHKRYNNNNNALLTSNIHCL